MVNELRLNKEQVSHIKITDKHKGIESFWNGYLEYDYRPTSYFYFLWVFKSVHAKAGYYRKGYKQNSWTSYIEEIPESCFDLNGELWSRCKIEIFSGETKIKTIYFKDINTAKKYCDKNFNNVNIIL